MAFAAGANEGLTGSGVHPRFRIHYPAPEDLMMKLARWALRQAWPGATEGFRKKSVITLIAQPLTKPGP